MKKLNELNNLLKSTDQITMPKSVQQYLNDIEDTEPLEKEEEKKLIRKAQNGDDRAFDKVIRSNLRFVVKVAKSYVGQGLPMEDLISEGNYGLVKALRRFDLDKDVKLISYGI